MKSDISTPEVSAYTDAHPNTYDAHSFKGPEIDTEYTWLRYAEKLSPRPRKLQLFLFKTSEFVFSSCVSKVDERRDRKLTF